MTDATQPGPRPDPSGLSAWLSERPSRPGAETPLSFEGQSRQVVLERPEEIAVAAVGALVLERAAAHQGTRLPARVIRQVRERLTQPFQSREVMHVEVEAYDVLAWLAGLAPTGEAVPAEPPTAREAIEYDPDMPVLDLLRRALAEEFDVEIQYYTQSRGALTQRRVSPNHIEAETYLHAYCHARREERVFRISRIAEIRPVDGRAVSQVEEKQREPEQGRLL